MKHSSYYQKIHFSTRRTIKNPLSYSSFYKKFHFPTRRTIKKSTFFPQTVFAYFEWIREHTAIISPYRINWVVFIYTRYAIQH